MFKKLVTMLAYAVARLVVVLGLVYASIGILSLAIYLVLGLIAAAGAMGLVFFVITLVSPKLKQGQK